MGFNPDGTVQLAQLFVIENLGALVPIQLGRLGRIGHQSLI